MVRTKKISRLITRLLLIPVSGLILLSSLKANPEKWSNGVASWYYPKHRHIKIYGTNLLVANNEHKAGTMLVVENGRRKVIVTVCGKGPFVKNRKLDLSKQAFARLANPSRGLIYVRYRVLGVWKPVKKPQKEPRN